MAREKLFGPYMAHRVSDRAAIMHITATSPLSNPEQPDFIKLPGATPTNVRQLIQRQGSINSIFPGREGGGAGGRPPTEDFSPGRIYSLPNQSTFCD